MYPFPISPTSPYYQILHSGAEERRGEKGSAEEADRQRRRELRRRQSWHPSAAARRASVGFALLANRNKRDPFAIDDEVTNEEHRFALLVRSIDEGLFGMLVKFLVCTTGCPSRSRTWVGLI